MIVKLKLDPKVLWRLEAEAEKKGMTLGEFVAHRYVPKRSRVDLGDRTRAEVVRLHGEGFTDAQIAARVGRVQEHVARLRRAAGLKSNRKKVGK